MRTSVIVLLLGALAACDSASPVPDFGDPYTVESRPEPLLDGDTLIVRVSYSGGCEEHAFSLDYAREGETPLLWLRHDANGDTCEALITEDLSVFVPEAARQGRPVLLYVGETETISLQETLR